MLFLEPFRYREFAKMPESRISNVMQQACHFDRY